MKLSAWRVALRIARRDALRAKGRSALVIAMIALPVLGVSAADVSYRSTKLTVQQSADRQMGTAAALVDTMQLGHVVQQAPDPNDGTAIPSGDKPTAQELARAKQPSSELVKAALPAGARLLAVGSTTYVTTSTAYGETHAMVQDLDLNDPLTHGMVTLRQGRLPRAAYEVAATQAFLDKAGLAIGSTTELVGSKQPLTVTAAVEFPGDLGNERLIGRPGELSGLLAAMPQADTKGGDGADRGSWLVQLPGNAPFGWDSVVRANGYGFTVVSRAVLADPPPHSAVPLFQNQVYPSMNRSIAAGTVTVLVTVVGMALLEIVLLAGPAFAVGARRSRRQLGLIAAGGGDRSHVRAVVLGGGIVLGAIGALVGIVLGALVVLFGQGWLEDRNGARFGGYTLNPVDLLGVVAVGLVTGLLAAIVPALQASRQEVVASLTGRGILKAPPRKLTVLGAVAVAAGTALALLGYEFHQREAGITGGSMIAELGLVACTPFLVGQFGRLSSRLPLGPRLALRDATRNRGRTAPAVAAVMAAVAGAVAVTAYQASGAAENRAGYVATAPSGALTLNIYGDRAAAELPPVRAAVERTAADLGPRGDVYRVVLPGCGDGKDCGQPTLLLPPERACPAFAGTGPNPGSTGDLSADEQKRIMQNDPRCRSGLGHGMAFDPVVAGDATVLHNLFGSTDPALVQALAQGRMLVPDARFVKDGKATLSIAVYPGNQDSGSNGMSDSSPVPTIRTVTVPAVAVTAPVVAASALISPDAARQAGMSVTPIGSVWLPQQALSSADEQRITAAAGQSDDASVNVERGYTDSTGAIAIALAIAAAVVAVGAAGIATGLAAADSQADLATLAAVGAAPRIRRTLSGFQCAVIALMGALLGSAAGLVPAAALWNSHTSDATAMGAGVYNRLTALIETRPSGALVVPWGSIALIVIGLPALSWLLAAGLTRSRMLMVRRLG